MPQRSQDKKRFVRSVSPPPCMKKIIQKQLAFYKLYSEYKADPKRFVQIWEFVGEIHVKELHRWGLMSYTCVHRVFEVFRENPGLIERRKVTGKSGARYFEYRIAPNPSVDKIRDDALRSFYAKITGKPVPSMAVITEAQADKIFKEL